MLRILLLFVLTSCAGYRVKTMENPFAQYGIKSISIPMFVNHSVFPQVSSLFTKEIIMSLEGHKDLEVFSGDHFDETDAVLIGVVTSNQYLKKAKSSSSYSFTSGDLRTSIGDRQPFYLPYETELGLTLRLILIKKPTPEEIELLTKVYPQRFVSPQIIFNEDFSLSYTYRRAINANLDNDDAGIVNQTKNKGSMQKALQAMAKNSSSQFKELIINAF